MNFDEAVEQATQSSDVEGIPKRFGKKVVRRKVPAGYTVASRKKTKKKEDDEEEELSELFRQLSPAEAYYRMWKFWQDGDDGDDEDDGDDGDDEDDDERLE
jgi:hypothetical protein